jgi:hypothetical protein
MPTASRQQASGARETQLMPVSAGRRRCDASPHKSSTVSPNVSRTTRTHRRKYNDNMKSALSRLAVCLRLSPDASQSDILEGAIREIKTTAAMGFCRPVQALDRGSERSGDEPPRVDAEQLWDTANANAPHRDCAMREAIKIPNGGVQTEARPCRT